MTLGGYLWSANTQHVREDTADSVVVLPLLSLPLSSPARTHVRTIASCQMSFSMLPSAGLIVASSVAEGLSCRASVWYFPGGGVPASSVVSPYGAMNTVDYILGWSELVCGAVVQGGDGSFTLKYGFPKGVLECNTFRKITVAARVGICVALFDSEGNWPSFSVNPIYQWSAAVGARTLTALNS